MRENDHYLRYRLKKNAHSGRSPNLEKTINMRICLKKRVSE